MKEPSLKITKKQIRRYGIEEGDSVPCWGKYLRRRIRAFEGQGYVRLSGPYFFLHRKEWEQRGREWSRDVVWAVRKKPGRKYSKKRQGRG
jgi:hypothetical protein